MSARSTFNGQDMCMIVSTLQDDLTYLTQKHKLRVVALFSEWGRSIKSFWGKKSYRLQVDLTPIYHHSQSKEKCQNLFPLD